MPNIFHLPNQMNIPELVKRIETLNRGLSRFWKSAHGWAPVEAAGLLSKSRLDWQVSLSSSLILWWRDSPNYLNEGELILAWVNLGTLFEGTIKLFLSIYYTDYRNDISILKDVGAFDYKKDFAKSPDGLGLDTLKRIIVRVGVIDKDDEALIDMVQKRRNAVHAFQDREIGNDAELWSAIRGYRKFLNDINSRLPYPDDMCPPQEI